MSRVLSDTPPPNTSVSPPGCAGVISKIKYQNWHSSYIKPPCSSPLHLRKRQMHSSNCSNQKHNGHVDIYLFVTSQLIYHDILLDLTSNTTYSEFDLFLWPCHHHHVLPPNSSVQFICSVMSDFVTLWTAARQASLSITISRSLLTHVHWVGDAIQSSHPLPSPFNRSKMLSAS